MDHVGSFDAQSGGYVEVGLFHGEIAIALNYGEVVFLNVAQARQLAGLLQQAACEVQNEC